MVNCGHFKRKKKHIIFEIITDCERLTRRVVLPVWVNVIDIRSGLNENPNSVYHNIYIHAFVESFFFLK